MGVGRIHHEHCLILLDCERARGRTRCIRRHFGNRFRHSGAHGARLGKLHRRLDFESSVGVQRR